jgi:hypothetical protein
MSSSSTPKGGFPFSSTSPETQPIALRPALSRSSSDSLLSVNPLRPSEAMASVARPLNSHCHPTEVDSLLVAVKDTAGGEEREGGTSSLVAQWICAIFSL